MADGTARDWRAILARQRQEHVADHMDALTPDLRAGLEKDLLDLEPGVLEELVGLALAPSRSAPPEGLLPPVVTRKGEDRDRDDAARKAGERLLAEGRLACVLVAGGQGSRLKHPGPKGTYPATPVRKKTLFRLCAEKIRARSRASGAEIPLCVMTSVENHDVTTRYFAANSYLGLRPESVRFFTQGMLPAVDETGKLVFKAPGALFLSPNGHGGTLLALRKSGILDQLEQEGVRQLFYFQIDNPLVDVCDPVFIGYHATSGSEFSSKVVAKTDPAEKVGVLAMRGGKMMVIEYSDLPADLREARRPDGSLVYSAGNVAIHLLDTAFVRRLTDGKLRLPIHLARKALMVADSSGMVREIPGIKFETFIFDALAEAKKTLVLEVRREDEFAPIKNATGVDSPATSSALQSARCARRLIEAGVPVPLDESGAPRVPIEISPLFATGPADLKARVPARLGFDAPVYLGED
jgi:UDP-N-acetylglucosamine/UDP-N-acetylgalactosamine diphosphorylase